MRAGGNPMKYFPTIPRRLTTGSQSISNILPTSGTACGFGRWPITRPITRMPTITREYRMAAMEIRTCLGWVGPTFFGQRPISGRGTKRMLPKILIK